MTILFFCAAWLVGIWLASIMNWGLPVWFGLAGGGLLAWVWARRRPSLTWLPAVLLGVSLGGARYVTAVPHITPAHIAHYNDGDELTLTGLVIAEPDVRDRSTNLRVQAETVTLPDGTETAVTGKVQVRAFRYPEIAYGMRLRLTGLVETPPEFEDFSYKEYLARQGVHSLMNLP
ncbi:MAG: ComEC/Rec2 family competence protein, partial [Anaerolineae bacterium]